MTKPPKVADGDEAAMARKLRATPRSARLAEFMCADADEGLGLWKEKGHAALFLAAYAALAGLKPVKLNPKLKEHKLEDVVNYYSVQKSIQDIGELAALHLAVADGPSVDDTLANLVPGLVEAGAEALEPVLRGPDPLPRLVEKLEGFASAKARR